jgi:hypothetical protein
MSSAIRRFYLNFKCKFMKKSFIALVTIAMVSAATVVSVKAFAKQTTPLECPGGSKKCCTDDKGNEYKIEVSAQDN